MKLASELTLVLLLFNGSAELGCFTSAKVSAGTIIGAEEMASVVFVPFGAVLFVLISYAACVVVFSSESTCYDDYLD